MYSPNVFQNIEIISKILTSVNLADLDHIHTVKLLYIFCFIIHIIIAVKTDIVFIYLPPKSIWKALGAFLGSYMFLYVYIKTH